MQRNEMIKIIGHEYVCSNTETDEWSYSKAFKNEGLKFEPIKSSKGNRKYDTVDIRFVKDNVTVLVETKTDFSKNLELAKEQLSAYVQYEKELNGHKVIAILANTNNDRIMVWRSVVSDSDFLPKHTQLIPMDDYVMLFTPNINNKEMVMKNTYTLNEKLHKHGISEKLRSQFVGTCLLALKNGLVYDSPMSSSQIRIGIKDILEKLLNNNIDKADKLALLNNRVLKNQDVETLDEAAFRDILSFIEGNILPFINDKSTAGQDLLNLFFVTFNKYVGKADKNQAFTPDHITDFMAKITNVDKKTIILDPCCGSGSFLVRAMTQALDDCSTSKEQEIVKKEHIFGIEYDKNIYGLATTNMLIHSDGNSNLRNDNCFNLTQYIINANPDVILMNPPYNAQKKFMCEEYTKTWKANQKEDPSKGLYFVKYLSDIINKNYRKPVTLAVLLPVACAIGGPTEIKNIKNELLQENTLEAVFTLPNEIFYPGASASACCMVFTLGKKHGDTETFFGYYKDDGFKKKKNLGRVEQVDENGDSKWEKIEKRWIKLYRGSKEVDGLSVMKHVTGDDEWLCEAYMKTDYSTLSEDDFQKTINDYMSYLIKEGNIYES